MSCKGNYTSEKEIVSVYNLPLDPEEQQRWTDVIPLGKGQIINPSTFRLCRKHWTGDAIMVHPRGGRSRPRDPPSIFNNIPQLCLPTQKFQPRPPKKEFARQSYFDRNNLLLKKS